MSQSKKIHIFVMILFTSSQGFTRKTVCSKFHYEEKLLEKMIRQEIKVEDLETEIQKALQQLNTFMGTMEEKLDNKIVDIDNQIKLNLEKISVFVDNVNQRMDNKVRDMNNKVKLEMDKVSVFVDDVKQRMDTFAEDMTTRHNELQLLKDKFNVPRVAFNVYNVKDVNVVKNGQVFIFTTILLNEGSGYDSSTGIFTASIAGLYYFTVHVCSYAGKYVYYAIIVDDQPVTVSEQNDNESYSCSSVSTVNALQTGSTVSVQSTNSASLNIVHQDNSYRRVSFSGVLLHL